MEDLLIIGLKINFVEIKKISVVYVVILNLVVNIQRIRKNVFMSAGWEMDKLVQIMINYQKQTL